MGIHLHLSHLGLLLLLLISFNHAGRQKLVSADETLIRVQCNNADVPPTCVRCLESDPQSQSADKVGIAAIVITCLSDKAGTLSGNMSALASAVHEKEVKSMLQSCEKWLSVAMTRLANATRMLEAGEYDGTNENVVAALVRELDCRQNVEAHNVTVPDGVVYDMRVYEELSEAALRIVDRF
ncbi:putative RING/U-box superfamily protein [Hibiscus syriacus]|uniref:RING/U-box superfamily protein n=2 Tax=Hibiscus syriacus TaxID=106335 RepID=A0A6A2YAQ8_HIBSY|nr:putative RING/U-box superfamily protein [Hibiscus syriacus]